jgi:hypothetical protein
MLSGKSISWKVLKVESVDVFRSHAEAAAGQYVKHSRSLSHHYLRDNPCWRSVCEAAGLFRSIRGMAAFLLLPGR